MRHPDRAQSNGIRASGSRPMSITILHGAEIMALALSESEVGTVGRGDDGDMSSLDDFEGRIDRRGENRGSAGMLLKANAADDRDRKRNVRFIAFSE